MEFKIEKNIPIPKAKKSRLDVLTRMKPNESIILPNRSASGYAYSHAKNNKIKIVARQLENKTYRVWVVADKK